MKGIAEMFAELDGYDAYDDALYQRSVNHRARAVERTRQWRKDNPKRQAQIAKRYRIAWRKRNPDKLRAAKAKHRNKNRERYRALWRKNSAKYQAKKRAAKSANKS